MTGQTDQLVPVLAAVIKRDGCYLVCKRPASKRHGGLWEFPGGKLEPGETMEEAARRELSEELGVGVKQVQTVLASYRDPGSLYLIEFVSVLISGEPVALEHEELAWASPESLRSMNLAPCDRRFVLEELPLRGSSDSLATRGDHPMTRERGQFDSSRTRVAPVFNALRSRSDEWVGRLLDLAADPAGPHPWREQDLQVVDTAWAPKERRLAPPVALLEWLVSNVSAPAEGLPDEHSKSRQRLFHRDEAAIAEALARIRRGETKRGWHILEGPSSPDAFVATKDALVVVEGKRTESGPTTTTTRMQGRHQMLRHLDAAWEVRDGRSVYGLFIVEANIAQHATDVPVAWRTAALATTSADAIKTSFPHRTAQEQRRIADCFVGITTWQAIVKEFQLDHSVLPEMATPNPDR